MSWSVYLLTDGTRTYVGSTTDVNRRLRQHNGEIVGGARSTRGRKWKLYAYVEGFENRSSACRWERIIKCRARGLHNRVTAMSMLTYQLCPVTRKLNRIYEVPGNLHMGVIQDGS